MHWFILQLKILHWILLYLKFIILNTSAFHTAAQTGGVSIICSSYIHCFKNSSGHFQGHRSVSDPSSLEAGHMQLLSRKLATFSLPSLKHSNATSGIAFPGPLYLVLVCPLNYLRHCQLPSALSHFQVAGLTSCLNIVVIHYLPHIRSL